jgi:hypothetical protein
MVARYQQRPKALKRLAPPHQLTRSEESSGVIDVASSDGRAEIQGPKMKLMALLLPLLVALLSVIAPLQGYAQTLIPAVFIKAEPTQELQEGRLTSCGLDISIGAHLTAAGLDVTRVAMLSEFTPERNISLIGFLADSVRGTVPPKLVSRGNIEAAWIRLDQGDAMKLTALAPSSTGHMVGVGNQAEVTLAMIKIIEGGARIQTGIRLKGASAEEIYTGIAKMDEADKLAARACIKEMFSRTIGTKP